MHRKPAIFAMPGNEKIAGNIQRTLSADTGEMVLRQFPDGESYVRILTEVSRRVVLLVCSLYQPDKKLVPLYLVAKTLKDLGAEKVVLVAPYLGYMRQDKAFHPGEGITARYSAELLSSFIDGIITVDPHLHRIHSLSEIYSVPNRVVHASPAIAAWIRENIENPLLIGPDGESKQWVAKVADQAGAPFIVLQKRRLGDKKVEITLPEMKNNRDRRPVLIDDIISTARTMVEATRLLTETGMLPPVCIGVHAVFADENALDLLKSAGAGMVVTCNTIPHTSNAIDLTELIAEATIDLINRSGSTN